MLPIYGKLARNRSLIRKTARVKVLNVSLIYDDCNKRQFLVLSSPIHIFYNSQIYHKTHIDISKNKNGLIFEIINNARSSSLSKLFSDDKVLPGNIQ